MIAAYERRMVDEIRSYLDSADQTKTAALEDLASRYAESCRAANERLARCADFLEQGLRSQAIQVAELEPDLRELVKILNFRELPVWQELAATYGLERIPPLKIDVATALDSAYKLEISLEPLLKHHRRLAVGQGTLKEKLAVMRQIAAIDPAPYWREDVRAFERQRATELIGLARAVRQTGEARYLKELVDDYEAEAWHGEAPLEVRQEYAILLRQLHERFTLPDLAGQIVAAMQHLDTSRLSSLRSRWDVVRASVSLHDPDWEPPRNLLAMVQPAFGYLKQEREGQRQRNFTRDVQSLQRAMRAEAEPEHVEDLIAKAKSYDLPLAPILQAEISEFKRSALETKLLWMGIKAAAVFAVLAILVICVFVLRDMFSGK